MAAATEPGGFPPERYSPLYPQDPATASRSPCPRAIRRRGSSPRGSRMHAQASARHFRRLRVYHRATMRSKLGWRIGAALLALPATANAGGQAGVAINEILYAPSGAAARSRAPVRIRRALQPDRGGDRPHRLDLARSHRRQRGRDALHAAGAQPPRHAPSW